MKTLLLILLSSSALGTTVVEKNSNIISYEFADEIRIEMKDLGVLMEIKGNGALNCPEGIGVYSFSIEVKPLVRKWKIPIPITLYRGERYLFGNHLYSRGTLLPKLIPRKDEKIEKIGNACIGPLEEFLPYLEGEVELIDREDNGYELRVQRKIGELLGPEWCALLPPEEKATLRYYVTPDFLVEEIRIECSLEGELEISEEIRFSNWNSAEVKIPEEVINRIRELALDSKTDKVFTSPRNN